MKLRYKYFLLIMVSISLASCSGQNLNCDGSFFTSFYGNQEFDFYISSDECTYTFDEDIIIKMELYNNNFQPYMIVNSRMHPTKVNAVVENSVNFHIIAPSGDLLSYDVRVNPRSTTSKDFVNLYVGQGIFSFVGIDSYYSFDEVGIYTIRAVYNNEYDDPLGQETWKGSVESNEIQIKIIP